MNHSVSSRMEQIRHLHFIGIGGVGMSGIAQLCLARGYTVSGSDLHLSAMGEVLQKAGATIHIGHRAENVGAAEMIVISSAISAENPELQEAHRRGIPIRKRAEILGWLMSDRYGIAIAGAHGKTTTTSMVSRVLEAGRMDPTLIVGGEVLGTKSNIRCGTSDYVVVEADESDASFLYLPAKMVVVTNIDDDHMDHYQTMERMEATYVEFINAVGPDGLAILCVDNDRLRRLIPSLNVPVLTYGFSEDAEVRVIDMKSEGRASSYRVVYKGQDLGRFRVPVPGAHNVQNSTAAVAVAMQLGMPVADIQSGLEGFTGVKRRFQFIGKARGVEIYDDYAHHPTEVKATLKSARDCSPNRLVAVFQPHRFSRTQILASEFARSFGDADLVILLPIYAASEPERQGVSSELIYEQMSREHKDVMVLRPTGQDIRKFIPLIASQLQPGDYVMTIGAGDVTKMGAELVDYLSRHQVPAASNDHGSRERMEAVAGV